MTKDNRTKWTVYCEAFDERKFIMKNIRFVRIGKKHGYILAGLAIISIIILIFLKFLKVFYYFPKLRSVIFSREFVGASRIASLLEEAVALYTVEITNFSFDEEVGSLKRSDACER